MSAPDPGLCVICQKTSTHDRYELDEYELDTLEHEIGVNHAARLQRKHGTLPICANCFEKTGFVAEYDEEAHMPIQILPLKKYDV